jgi:hypothetical protein
MRPVRYFAISMLRSRRETFFEHIHSDCGKFFFDRQDVYVLDVDSFYEHTDQRMISVRYNLLTVQCDPDFDW